MRFTIAANDMQRDLVFPKLAREARKEGIDLSLELRPSGVPSVSLLRDAQTDLLLTPLPPDAPDMIQFKLFSGDMMCFFDSENTVPPSSIEEYLNAHHVTVQFALGGASNDVLKHFAFNLRHIPRPLESSSIRLGRTSHKCRRWP